MGERERAGNEGGRIEMGRNEKGGKGRWGKRWKQREKGGIKRKERGVKREEKGPYLSFSPFPPSRLSICVRSEGRKNLCGHFPGKVEEMRRRKGGNSMEEEEEALEGESEEEMEAR